LIGWLLALVGCAGTPPNSIPSPDPTLDFASAPIAPTAATVESAESAFFEDPGIIKSFGEEEPICIEADGPPYQGASHSKTVDLPSYADRATVFLNGWSVRYLDTDIDHHVVEFGAALHSIERDGDTLSWVAGGGMIDNGLDDPFEFCYVFTVIAWNSLLVHALVDHAEILAAPQFFNAGTNGNDATPLLHVASYRSTPTDDPNQDVAVLPRGFDFRFVEDRHLLQIAFAIDHSEAFLEEGNPYGSQSDPPNVIDGSRLEPTAASWMTSGILKDNARARPFVLSFDVSLLQGADVSLVSPPFAFRPGRTPEATSDGGCASPPAPEGEKREEFVVNNLPFDYVIPALTGWELTYSCDDEHVEQMGVWLEGTSYDKPVGEPGVLRYTLVSVLRDKDSKPAHERRHKVDLIGLNQRQASDLAPTAFAPPAFCRQDAEGRLIVRMTNMGVGPAPSSTTRVQFPDLVAVVDIDTPELAGGFDGDLPPITLPAGCASGCLLTVEADALGEVTELNETNNTIDGRCSLP
jgi:hypothetical protein